MVWLNVFVCSSLITRWKTGVCVSTLGPGATNFTTAAAYAQLGGMPMMMVTGQKPVKKSKQGRFQILDVVEMMKPITKYAVSLVAGDNIPSRIREAYRIAEEEKPGAVHIELPEDIADEETDAEGGTDGGEPVGDTGAGRSLDGLQVVGGDVGLLDEGADPRALERSIHEVIEVPLLEKFNVPKPWPDNFYFAQAITDIHLKSHREQEISVNNDIGYVLLFASIAVLVLFIACINYVNLTTARSARRGRRRCRPPCDPTTVLVVEAGPVAGGMMTGGLGGTDVGIGDTIGGLSRNFFERVGAAVVAVEIEVRAVRFGAVAGAHLVDR